MGLATIEDTFNRMAKALERLADATEATQKALMAARPITFKGHEVVSNLTPAELKGGTDTFPGTDAIAKAMNDACPVTIAYETINKAILSYSDRFGQEAAKGLLKRFGATIIKDLKANPAKYAEVLEATKVGP
jgi:hypothetical protein